MNEVDYRAIRRRVTLRWLNRLLFVMNTLLFIAVIDRLSYGGIYIDSNSIVVWFLILVGHFLWAFNIVGSFIQRQTEREAQRLRARGYTVIAPERDAVQPMREKPKRAARLADDGEIEYDERDAMDESPMERRARSQD